MIVGFTGTRKGMTPEQQTTFCRLLNSLSVHTLHHGDCIGSDAQAHAFAKAVNVYLHVHPSINPKYRAFCTGYHAIEPPAENGVRNRTIVQRTQTLIATPKGTEVMRSGTWMTIRYARTCNLTLRIPHPIWIIWPDGSVEP